MDLEDKDFSRRCSHTLRRRGWWGREQATTIEIVRPTEKDGDMTVLHFSDVDTYLLENGIDCVSKINRFGYYGRKENTKLRLPMEEVEVVLQMAATSVSKVYNAFDSTCSTIYKVPSQHIFGELSEASSESSSCSPMVLVDGKLYDSGYIYTPCTATNSFVKLCPLHIPKPIFNKNQQLSSHFKVDQLPVRALRTDVPDKLHKHPSGILLHSEKANVSGGIPVYSDLIIDLGSPQLVTHIGTVGSFVPFAMYPEHPPAGTVFRDKRNRRRFSKYKNRICVEQASGDASWAISYRLFFKSSHNEAFVLVGSYKANSNAFDLVVNDVSADLGNTPVRYLMLKPVSNKHRKPIARSREHPVGRPLVRLNIAVYGNVSADAADKMIANSSGAGEGSGDKLIEYRITPGPANVNSGSLLTASQVSYQYYEPSNSTRARRRICQREAAAIEREAALGDDWSCDPKYETYGPASCEADEDFGWLEEHARAEGGLCVSDFPDLTESAPAAGRWSAPRLPVGSYLAAVMRPAIEIDIRSDVSWLSARGDSSDDCDDWVMVPGDFP